MKRLSILVLAAISLAMATSATGDSTVYRHQYDLNGDDRIDIIDITLVASHWGEREDEGEPLEILAGWNIFGDSDDFHIAGKLRNPTDLYLTDIEVTGRVYDPNGNLTAAETMSKYHNEYTLAPAGVNCFSVHFYEGVGDFSTIEVEAAGYAMGTRLPGTQITATTVEYVGYGYKIISGTITNLETDEDIVPVRISVAVYRQSDGELLACAHGLEFPDPPVLAPSESWTFYEDTFSSWYIGGATPPSDPSAWSHQMTVESRYN